MECKKHAIIIQSRTRASGDWLTSRPKGCLQPRELWFFDILMYPIHVHRLVIITEFFSVPYPPTSIPRSLANCIWCAIC